MCRMSALILLIFSLIPAMVQARQHEGSQSVTIGISLTIAPDVARQQRSILDCVERSVQRGLRGEVIKCRSSNFTTRAAESRDSPAVRVIPI